MNFTSKRIKSRESTSSWKKAFLAFFFIIYVLLIYIYYNSPYESGLKKDIESTTGKISKVKNNSFLVRNPQPIVLHQIRNDQSPESRTFMKYFYNFEFANRKYEGSYNPKLCFLSSCTQSNKIEFLDENQVRIFFDPQNPNVSWMFHPPQYTDLEIIFALGLISILLAIPLTMWGYRTYN